MQSHDIGVAHRKWQSLLLKGSKPSLKPVGTMSNEELQWDTCQVLVDMLIWAMTELLATAWNGIQYPRVAAEDPNDLR